MNQAKTLLKQLYQKYKHVLILPVYAVIYLPWFLWLERTVVAHYHVIHMRLDDFIPFNEVFVVPYFLWFLYIPSVIVFTALRDKGEYGKLCGMLITGMTVFLIVSTVFPNGHHLRPSVLERDNIFTFLVSRLWGADTPTNIFPSIHVFNSLAAHIAVMRCAELKRRRWARFGSFTLCASITLATVFLKQHSAFDVLTAFLMTAILYPLVYKIDYVAYFAKKKWEHSRS